VKFAFLSTAVVAAVATFGDWVWAAFLSQHLVIAGVVHGALLCLAMGAVLAVPGYPADAAKRRRRAERVLLGAAAGIAVGVAAAGLFYLLAPMLRMGAMLPAWFALWVMLSAMTRAFGVARRSWGETLARGALAGLLSGAAFYLVADMWTGWNPARINYLEHFARWAFAFAPGFLALQTSRRTPV
jgi:hypothetical protein